MDADLIVMQEGNQQVSALTKQLADVEELCTKFKEEAEKTMMDYSKLAEDYKQACSDKDNALKTLTRRNKEIKEEREQVCN